MNAVRRRRCQWITLRRTGGATAAVFMLLSTMASTHAATPPAGFALVGTIERFTLDDPASSSSGAVMRLRGVDVVLPRHLVITMPGGFLTARQIFKGRDMRQPIDPRNSGIALTDPKPANASACPGGP